MELERIFQKLERIEKLQETILARLDANKPESTAAHGSNDWIDSVKVRDILGISESTLYRIRKSKTLVPCRIGGRDYYYAPDIFRAARSMMK